MALAILRQAMKNASTPDDPGKVITLPPASIDGLIDQVKQIERRQATAQARHAAEVASLTWQHQSEAKALDARHTQERADIEAELARANDMFVKALAGRLGVDAADLEPPPEAS